MLRLSRGARGKSHPSLNLGLSHRVGCGELAQDRRTQRAVWMGFESVTHQTVCRTFLQELDLAVKQRELWTFRLIPTGTWCLLHTAPPACYPPAHRFNIFKHSCHELTVEDISVDVRNTNKRSHDSEVWELVEETWGLVTDVWELVKQICGIAALNRGLLTDGWVVETWGLIVKVWGLVKEGWE